MMLVQSCPLPFDSEAKKEKKTWVCLRIGYPNWWFWWLILSFPEFPKKNHGHLIHLIGIQWIQYMAYFQTNPLNNRQILDLLIVRPNNPFDTFTENLGRLNKNRSCATCSAATSAWQKREMPKAIKFPRLLEEVPSNNHIYIIEGSLEVKLPTIWADEKQSRAEAERRGRLEERRSEEKE